MKKVRIGFFAYGIHGGSRNRGGLSIPQLPDTMEINLDKISKENLEALKADKGIKWFKPSKEIKDDDSLESKSAKQLKEIAKKANLEFPGNISKAKLIELIEKNQEPPKDSEEASESKPEEE